MSLFLDELIFTLLRVLGSDFGIQNWYTGFKIALDTVLREQKVKPPPYQFFPVTSANVGLAPKTFYIFVLTLLPLCSKMSRPCPVPVPNY